MNSKYKLISGTVLLVFVHLAILLAGFVAPYDPTEQNRDFAYAPPARIHFVSANGEWRPFVRHWEASSDGVNQFQESNSHEYPVHFFVRGAHYKLAGILTSDMHLFGVEDPDVPIFLAGTDSYGRDQFSRILYGGQLSLATGLLATGISLLLGLLIGCISGFYGGWTDESVMCFTELFLVLPWLYLLLAVRAFLPLHITPVQAFLLLVVVIGTIGWARPARLVRGVVLSAKMRKYVAASRGFGASDALILRYHILPQTCGVLLTQAAQLVPLYIVSEVTLSFFGLGLSEPVPSWGNLLAQLQQYSALVSYWWMFAPALALVLISFGYHEVANALHEHLQTGSI